MDTRAHKCPSCKKAYQAIKVSQIYCSAKCRQAAYRKRKTEQPYRRQKEHPAIVLICNHCSGTFWAKRKTAWFCSTSCRTLYHRALRAAIPQALTEAYGLPGQKAADLIETQQISHLKRLLECAGYTYKHTERQWVLRNFQNRGNSKIQAKL